MMSIIRRRAPGIRLGALLGVAALSLHQLRYVAGHGAGADEALAAEGHGYLELLAPLVGGFSIALVAGLVVAAALTRSTHGVPSTGAFRHPLLCALALLATFCLQELAEGALSAGHPEGLDALLTQRGWVTLPLAVLLGALVSLAGTGLGRFEQRVAGTLARPRLRAPLQLGELYDQPVLRRLAWLALVFGFARRPPPPALVR